MRVARGWPRRHPCCVPAASAATCVWPPGSVETAVRRSYLDTGPQHEVLQAALHHVVGWAGGGAPPPRGAHLQVVEPTGKAATNARDSNGNALGGVHDPLVDVPVAAYIGVPPAGTTTDDLLTKANGACLPFGQDDALRPSEALRHR